MIKIKENNVAYETENSAGFDIKAAETGEILPGEVKAVSTGLFLEKSNTWIDKLLNRFFVFELQIRPRSGLALKHKITVLNSPGTVDLDYPEEIKVLLFNASDKPFKFMVGDRIAQGVVSISFRAKGVKIKKISRSSGFGSTGKN